jgi:hypothetical protein
MDTTASYEEMVPLLTGVGRLPAADRSAAEALVAAMAGWTAADLASYRASVLEEAAQVGGQARGFLAVELAALAVVGGPGV